MGLYRKKPVVIEAVQWTGKNNEEVQSFVGQRLKISQPLRQMEHERDDIPNEAYCVIIPTLEGDMKAIKGDWIIKGIKGEFYPCKPHIFKQTYETVSLTGEPLRKKDTCSCESRNVICYC